MSACVCRSPNCAPPRISDTIYLDATCDSLMALVVDYERRLADRSEIRTDERAERHWSSFVSGWIGPFIALFLLIYALWKR